MTILFLGTSAAKAFPRQNCHCPICTSKDKRDKRLRSSILVNNKFLIDCGPDILKQIKKFRIKTEKIKAIFITHKHTDHTAGLKDIKFPNIPLYISKITAQALDKKILSRFQVKIIKPYQKIKVNDLIFQPIPVIHPGCKSTFAFKIIQNNQRLIYMPDYKKIPKKSLKYFSAKGGSASGGRNINILIVGGSSLKKPLPWHATIEESIKRFTKNNIIKKTNLQKIYFTHIGHSTLPHKELVKFVEKMGGKKFNIAFDGKRIKV